MYGCKAAYLNDADMLDKHELDGVIIASPPVAHFEQISRAISAGVKYILCEKPLTLTLAEALDIRTLANKENAKVIEAFHYRHMPLFEQTVKMSQDPAIGKMDHIRGHIHLALPRVGKNEGWRRDVLQSGGVCHEYACYPVDTINNLAGAPPVSVSAWMDDERSRLYGRITYLNGVMGIVEASYNSAFDQGLYVSASQGAFRVPNYWSASEGTIIEEIRVPNLFEREVKSAAVPSLGEQTGQLIDWPVFELQLADFVRAIETNGDGRVSLDESVRNMAVINGFVESACSGETVPVRH